MPQAVRTDHSDIRPAAPAADEGQFSGGDSRRSLRLSLGMAALGTLASVAVTFVANAVMVIWALMALDGAVGFDRRGGWLLLGATVLIIFLGGRHFWRRGSARSMGFGFGLMLGWILATVVTLGEFTMGFLLGW